MDHRRLPFPISRGNQVEAVRVRAEQYHAMQRNAMQYRSLAAVDIFSGITQESSFYMWELPMFAVIATLGGLLGAGFVGINKRFSLFRARHLAGARRRLAEASYFEAYLKGTHAIVRKTAHTIVRIYTGAASRESTNYR